MVIAGTNITYRGYVIPKTSLPATELESIRKELTVKPYIPKDYQMGPTKSYPLYLESENHLYVPKHFGLDLLGAPEHSQIFPGRPLDASACHFQGSMREEQLAACRAYFEHARASEVYGGGGILNLPCGFGKTVIGLYIVSQLRLKTLIIVHKDFLLQQWRERISQFLPNISVGKLKASVVDAGDDRDIVIASLQSLSMKDYDVKSLFQSFGLVIVDECHHTSAEVFSNALKKTCFKYTLGLSATLQRKDGLSRVFKWFLGPVAYKPPKQPPARPLTTSPSGAPILSVHTVMVKIREFFDIHPAYTTERYMMGGTKLNVSRMINQICEYTPRNAFIAKEIHEILKKDPHRRVLILSDRRDHLRALAAELETVGVVRGEEDYGFYQGGLDQNTLKASERKKIILGTFQFVAEGFDVPGLDTLVLASPKSDIIQSVGRILRQRPEDRTYPPLVLDITDDISLFPAQAKKRRAYYNSKRYWIDDGPNQHQSEEENEGTSSNAKPKRASKRMTAEEIADTFRSGMCFILDEDNG